MIKSTLSPKEGPIFTIDGIKIENPYYVQNLCGEMSAEVYELHRLVLDELKEAGKPFLVSSTLKSLEELFGASGETFGIYDWKSHELAASASIAFLKKADPNTFLKYQPIIEEHGIDLSLAVIFQSAVVHPAHRSKNLHKWLLMARSERAQHLGYDTALCRVDKNNKGSLDNLINYGFQPLKDPTDNTTHTYLGYPLRSLQRHLRSA